MSWEDILKQTQPLGNPEDWAMNRERTKLGANQRTKLGDSRPIPPKGGADFNKKGEQETLQSQNYEGEPINQEGNVWYTDDKLWKLSGGTISNGVLQTGEITTVDGKWQLKFQGEFGDFSNVTVERLQ